MRCGIVPSPGRWRPRWLVKFLIIDASLPVIIHIHEALHSSRGPVCRKASRSKGPGRLINLRADGKFPSSANGFASYFQKSWTVITRAATAMTAVAAQPTILIARGTVALPMMSLRAVISIITAMTGTATTPLTTALQ